MKHQQLLTLDYFINKVYPIIHPYFILTPILVHVFLIIYFRNMVLKLGYSVDLYSVDTEDILSVEISLYDIVIP